MKLLIIVSVFMLGMLCGVKLLELLLLQISKERPITFQYGEMTVGKSIGEMFFDWSGISKLKERPDERE